MSSWQALLPNLDASTVRAARLALAGERRGLRATLPFLGPAFIASIAYVDPGNFATNIQSGASFGYLLLWVVLASNLMAMFVQALSAKLGIATGRNLAEVCRDQFPLPAVWVFWGLSELVAMATDLAEVLGAAIGFQLLFGIPLLSAGFLTAGVTFAILGLQRYGFRPLEAVLTALLAVIAACYVVETLFETPNWSEVARHALVPQFDGPDSVLLGVGIVGATVMPHVVFLHSHLIQRRVPTPDPVQARRVFRFAVLDIVVAMTIAGLINSAMLVMAASTFHATGQVAVGTMQVAYNTLTPLLGAASSTVFALSLLISGLSASTVGTMAGQVIMAGYIRRAVPVWVRRLVTIVPALLVMALGLEPMRTLVMSQVVLSFCLPVALIPLALFTGRRDLMGQLVNQRAVTLTAAIIVTAIIALNALLLGEALSAV
ncbi:MAG TPA: Nramp family divalent metal transporter [Chloroflexota bacterium]